MNERAVIGGNLPPDPLDEIISAYSDVISECENWLDGEAVTTDDQMKAVDKIAKQIKAAKKDVTAAQKSESAPLHDAWKASLARFKPTIEDLDRMTKGLAALVDGFKRKLAEEKRAKERAAWEAAEKARKEAEAKAAAADTANIEEQREAEEARRAAQEAEKAAQAARRDAKDVKGLRTVTRYEITDHKAALHWIAANDRDAMTVFIEDYVRRNHKAAQIDGVRVWQDKEAF